MTKGMKTALGIGGLIVGAIVLRKVLFPPPPVEQIRPALEPAGQKTPLPVTEIVKGQITQVQKKPLITASTGRNGGISVVMQRPTTTMPAPTARPPVTMPPMTRPAVFGTTAPPAVTSSWSVPTITRPTLSGHKSRGLCIGCGS